MCKTYSPKPDKCTPPCCREIAVWVNHLSISIEKERIREEMVQKKSQPEKNQEPAFHPLFVNPKKVEFENVFGFQVFLPILMMASFQNK